MRNRGQLWDEIKKLSNEHWELYEQVKKLEDDTYLNDRITKESLKQFSKIYKQIEEIRSKKFEVFKQIYKVSKQTDLYED